MSDHKPYRDSHEPDEPLREHVFDGIREFDKKLPNWWLLTLYGTIVFSIAYWAWFHIYDIAPTPEEKLALAQERAAAHAAANRGFDNERLFQMALESSVADRGRSTYMASCAACHGMELEGGIGSKLVDGDWVHGSQPMEILKVILDGVAEKGMPPWRGSLGETRSAEVTAYILSKNPGLLESATAANAAEEESPSGGER